MTGAHGGAGGNAIAANKNAVAGTKVLDPDAIRAHRQQGMSLAHFGVTETNFAGVATSDCVTAGGQFKAAVRLAGGLYAEMKHSAFR